MNNHGSINEPAAISEHAKSRMEQRQISPDVVSLIYEESDIVMPGTGGCIQLALSRRKLGTLAQSRGDAKLLRNAQDVAIVLEVASDKIVTVYRLGLRRRRDWDHAIARRSLIRRPR